MKKSVCLLLCLWLMLCMTACEAKFSPAEEVLALRNDAISYPAARFDFDNSSSARQLVWVSRERLAEVSADRAGMPAGMMGAFSASIYWIKEDFAEKEILLRYNYGRYYSVARVREGGYLFTLYEESGEWLVLCDSCYVKKLTDVQKIAEVQPGTPVETILKRFPEGWYWEYGWKENGRILSTTHRLNDLTTVSLVYEDGKYVRSGIYAPESSVLTYLLPQDLELIS